MYILEILESSKSFEIILVRVPNRFCEYNTNIEGFSIFNYILEILNKNSRFFYPKRLKMTEGHMFIKYNNNNNNNNFFFIT